MLLKKTKRLSQAFFPQATYVGEAHLRGLDFGLGSGKGSGLGSSKGGGLGTGLGLVFRFFRMACRRR